ISSFESSLATESGNANILLDIEQYGLGRDYIINFADRVNAVSMDEISAAARKHLNPQALAIAAVGPADRLQVAFSRIGPVSIKKP
ncbi:MAG TPA: hypothetical protein VEZ90_04920, partial [Blastocatellia bacterium]|nr:hypothetical protein [Blastocatellia bacterium]